MNLSKINDRLTYYTGQTTSNYTTANRLDDVNQAIDEIETIIMRSQDDWEFDDLNQSGDPIFLVNSVAGTQDYAIATIDANIVQIKRVEITYDGVKWNKCDEINLEEYTNSLDATTVSNYFLKVEPKYAVVGNKLKIFPIPDQSLTGAIRIVVGRLQVPFTTSDWNTGTAVPGINRQFHDAIARRASFNYAFIKSLNNAATLGQLVSKDEAAIIDWYSHKIKDKKYAMKARAVNYK